MRRLVRRTFAVGVTLAGTLSCSAPPPAPPAAVPVAVPAPRPPEDAPPTSPARWIETGGATAIGPILEDGTLVLLGGRRAKLGNDGVLRGETAPAPEPLLEIVEVPGAAGRRLVARGLRTVVRLDDPLGAPTTLARSESVLTRLGAAPGSIAVWDAGSDVPRWLDVETGAPKGAPRAPELPMRAVQFADEKLGAAVFHAVGLATTRDGGATWRPALETTPGDALRITRLALRGGALRALVHEGGFGGEVDLARSKLGPLAEASPEPNAPPLVRWIGATGRDPLDAAVTSGASSSGGALVASDGLLARVDTATGAVAELAPLGRGGSGPCDVGRAGAFVWLGCALEEDEGSDLYDPFAVLRVPLEGGRLAFERVFARNGPTELRLSPSGGAMLLAACRADEAGEACVAQPDGRWATVATEPDLAERGAGPLLDGRIAFVRGLIPGEGPTEEPLAAPVDEPAAAPHLVAVDAAGLVRVLGEIDWKGPADAELRVGSPVEEHADRSLTLVLSDERGAQPFVLPFGAAHARREPLGAGFEARMRAGRGIAVGEGRVLASNDRGASWRDAHPPRLAELVGSLGDGTAEPGTLVAGEVGAKLGTHIRLGWGATELSKPAAKEPVGPLLSARTEAAAAAPRLLTCKVEGEAKGTPMLRAPGEVKALLETKGPPPKGMRRSATTAPLGKRGLVETMALLEEQGPEARGAAASSYSLAWIDPGEVFGMRRSVTVPAPKGAQLGARLESAAARGPRALFVVRSSAGSTLVHVKARGAAEVASVPREMLPAESVVFGSDKDELVAWLHDGSVFVWRAGEEPRRLASFAQSTTALLGEPSAAGVPVLVAGGGWSLLHVLAMPSRDKAKKSPALAPATLEGFVRVADVGRDLAALPSCGATAKGARFSLARSGVPVVVDGRSLTAEAAVYEVRIGAESACVAAVAALLPRAGKGPVEAFAAKPAGRPAAAAAPRVEFLRADFARKQAQGGERSGSPGPASLRKLGCALVPRP